ncbi:PEBP-like protein [Echria macrotheca]|uniref:PEBP-like protein n=1 Tax=Echria macrotheca TaxID=438768 RepID=A0AAJ0BPR4_9PEZI|nr:PEBP-like protein [Echria macrotheca]
MVSTKCLAGLLAAATLVSARTPSGFTPGSTTDLIVIYNGVVAMNGAVIPRASTADQPMVGILTKPSGTSFAIVMIDLDIPSQNGSSETNTLLHWMQTGLTPAAQATRVNTTTGQISVFLLQNTSNTTPLAAYIPPNPPARVPLSHRYTQILVDTSGVTTNSLGALRTAATNRLGFAAQTVLGQAGLDGKVVAGNFYNVTNPGPVNGTAGTGGGTGAGGGGPRLTGGAGRVGPTLGLVAGLAAGVAVML